MRFFGAAIRMPWSEEKGLADACGAGCFIAVPPEHLEGCFRFRNEKSRELLLVFWNAGLERLLGEGLSLLLDLDPHIANHSAGERFVASETINASGRDIHDRVALSLWNVDVGNFPRTKLPVDFHEVF